MGTDLSLLHEICALLKTGSAAAAYEAMDKRGEVSPCIRALVPDVMCIGPAYTVRAPAGYGDEIAPAADAAPPGSVIVIDIESEPGTAACTWGGTGTLVARRRGIAGVVSNGHVRDIAQIRRAGFPVFARGTVVSGWRKGQAGETGGPVSIGGQIVYPGDLVCADDDGVVIVSQRHFEQFAQRLEARLKFEFEADHLVRSGGSYAQVMQGKPG